MFGEARFETDKLPYFLSTNVKIVSAKAEEGRELSGN